MGEKLKVKPKLDVAFKALFIENLDLLKDFLSAALKMPVEEFAAIKITNPELLPESYNEKFARLDLVIDKPDGTKINVELQNCDEDNYKERSVFNCSKMFTRGVMAGQEYADIPKTVCINILQFNLFEKSDWNCTVFPTIQETGEIVTEKWQIIYFQTPKLPAQNSGGLLEWLKLFTVETREELNNMKENASNPKVVRAIDAFEMMNEDEKMKRLAETREDWLLNESLRLGASRRKGVLMVADNMYKMGMAIDVISKATGIGEYELSKHFNASYYPAQNSGDTARL